MQKALESIRFWRGVMIQAFFDLDVHDPRKIEENGQIIGDDTLQKMLLVISSAEDGIKKLKKYTELGFTEIVLTNSSPIRKELIKLVVEKISPHFESS
jgi:coenzyme F420-dependent glucose-6-phosphate dehydrogenase